MSASEDIKKQVAEDILEALENENLLPWQIPWIVTCTKARNLKSGNDYSGVNAFVLARKSKVQNWHIPVFLTVKQARDIGKDAIEFKGQKATRVIFFKQVTKQEDDTEKKFGCAKFYNVFHYTQFGEEFVKIVEEKYPDVFKFEENVHNTDERFNQADELIAKYCQSNSIHFESDKTVQKAFYKPSADMICIPVKERFKHIEDYYVAAFHEMVHSTGTVERLKRDVETNYSEHAYSFEELVAQIGAEMLLTKFGIANRTEQSADYIKGWASRIKSSLKDNVLKAALEAQKALNYICE